MSSTKQQSTKQKNANSNTGPKPGRKTSGITGRSRRRPAGDSSAKTSSNSESQNCGGLLRSAIEREVARNSDQIAKALVDGSIHGNISGAKLLIDISGAKTARNDSGTRAAWSAYLDELENEKPWTGPMEDDEESDEDDEESNEDEEEPKFDFIDPLL